MGKRLGIIGLGAIGVKVANVARHLGMEVLGYDPYVSVDAAWKLSRDVRHVLDVNEIYEQCDYITIHVPLMDSTKNMISAVKGKSKIRIVFDIDGHERLSFSFLRRGASVLRFVFPVVLPAAADVRRLSLLSR